MSDIDIRAWDTAVKAAAARASLPYVVEGDYLPRHGYVVRTRIAGEVYMVDAGDEGVALQDMPDGTLDRVCDLVVGLLMQFVRDG